MTRDVETRFKLPRKAKRSKMNRDRAELRATKRSMLERSLGRCEAGFSLMCTGVGTQAHHVRRRSQGGTNDLANLKWCCEPCHTTLHAQPELAREVGLLAPKGDQ